MDQKDMDILLEAVKAQNTIVASVTTFIRSLSDRLAAAIQSDDMEQVRLVAQQVAANTLALSDAIAENVSTSAPVIIGTPDTPEAIAAHQEIMAGSAGTPIPDYVPTPALGSFQPDPQPPFERPQGYLRPSYWPPGPPQTPIAAVEPNAPPLQPEPTEPVEPTEPEEPADEQPGEPKQPDEEADATQAPDEDAPKT